MKFQVTRTLLSQLLKSSIHVRLFCTTGKMAKSKFEYVKSFETEDKLDPGHWIIIALKCCNMQRVIESHGVEHPNDRRLIHLVEDSAKCVMNDFKDLQLSYSFKDELSFVFPKNTTLYRRRGPKLLTNLCSLMSSSLVYLWPKYFESTALTISPVFEGTIYLLPNDQGLRDYMTQRQLVCHYQNLYDTVLWALVKNLGFSFEQAADYLKGTSEGDKNEILFSKCNLNYNNEEIAYKKGSAILRKTVPTPISTPDGSAAFRNQSQLMVVHTDFVKDSFWEEVFLLNETSKNSGKTGYLKDLEKKTKLLPHTWIVVRIDGKGFHRFSETHNFVKPNDVRSIELMNRAAHRVMEEYSDIVLSYGQSDEYTFVINRYSRMMERVGNKIMSCIVSLFASTYVYYWPDLFKDTGLVYPPAFDARVILYPNNSCLRDCLSWRQADCHINNMYNLCFWTLIQKGNMSPREADERLSGTFSKDKREILKNEFGCDYDLEDPLYRKGTILYRNCELKHTQDSVSSRLQDLENHHVDSTSGIVTAHIDMINDEFWIERPWILGTERGARTLEDLDD